MRVHSVLICLTLLVGMVAGCGEGGPQGKGPVSVGSKIDTEGALLAHIIILELRDDGFAVIDRSQLGPTQVVRKALLGGEIDLYPEYTGNGAFFFEDTDPSVWKDFEEGYQTVKRLDKEQNDIVWLQPAPANNTWAIAIPEKMSREENIQTLTDFARYVNEGGRVKLACSEEFVTSPMAMPALQETYGFELKDDQLLTFSSGNTAQTERAAARGTDGVNAAMAYGTDGAIDALGLVVLDDPKGAQPVYAPAPTVRQEVYRRHPEIGPALEPVFESLDRETLQRLNGRIAVKGELPQQVARDYLTSEGFLE